jgi:AbrB family looped-hinge helix DNA binding protein
MRTQVDTAGRLVIPLPLRRLLGLVDGGEVDLEATGDGLLIRRLEGSASVSSDDEGLPVVRLGGVGTVSNEEVLDAIEADRSVR